MKSLSGKENEHPMSPYKQYNVITPKGGNVVFNLPARYIPVVIQMANDFTPHYKVLGSGAQGAVIECHDTVTGTKVAVKKLLSPFRTELSAKRAYREFVLMRRTPPHPNIIQMLDAFTTAANYDEFDTLYIVMELMDFDLSAFRKTSMRVEEHEQLSFLVYQLLCAVNHLHRFGIAHRDLKPENLVVKNKGCELKLIDFGLARCSDEGLRMSSYVYTRWYRAPEVILMMEYTTKADIWAVGCIFAEIIKRDIYLPGKTHIDQWVKIAEKFGLPDQSLLDRLAPNVLNFVTNRNQVNFRNVPFENQFPVYLFPRDSLEHPALSIEQARDLLSKMLVLDPEHRLSAEDALNHPYVKMWSNPSEINPPVVEFQKLSEEIELTQTEGSPNNNVEHWKKLMWTEVNDYLSTENLVMQTDGLAL